MKKRLLLSVVTLALLLTSCGQPAASPTQTEVGPEPTATDEPTREPAASFEQAPCPMDLPDGAVETGDIMCGYVTVPEEHAQPNGKTIRLAVAVITSASDNPAPDPLVMLAGGPGSSALSAFTAMLFVPNWEGFRAQRDIVLVEQRGTLYSTPFLRCEETFDLMLETLARDLGYEDKKALNLAALTACRDRFISEGVNLSAYNSLENAADIVMVVNVLGYDEFNLYGGSYGTMLAQHIMRDYPEGVRSVILDAIAPLRHEPNLLHKAHSADRSLRLLFEQCAADPACREVYPDLETVFFDTVARLDQDPATLQLTDPTTGESHDMLLTGDELVIMTRDSLYRTPLLPVLPRIMTDVAGGDYAMLEAIQSQRLFVRDWADGMYKSVVCTEIADFTAEDFADADRLYPQVTTAIEELIAEVMLDPCEVWGVELLDDVTGSVVSDIPTLLLSGEFDPTTPPHLGEVAAERLSHAYVYTFPGVGHGVLGSGDCPVSMMVAFLDDPTRPPDASCIDEMPGVVFDVPVKITEVALEPFTNEELGISGVAPVGWTEAGPGVLLRSASAIDQTTLVQEAAPGETTAVFVDKIMAAFGLQEFPESVGSYESAALGWDLYRFEVEVRGVELALATALADGDAGGYMVTLIADPDEIDALYQAVFMSAVDALVPRE